ncbi:MAG TPA: 23S rRNA (adenine(2503)-C(2))-methyltransferase RlmN [Candidatus Aphodocola excrementigallinarum]|uniref:Probable dual-specificity RNA methyltransferase RlmN n=1 Tax=Candidatus Aphodocola excrementigallinarum TaxID=2840670 RepID=A0A9D1ILJ6_9FIRM|nr:23S rRNA (adenine(2503)-C(2))-methyltransferase RlmN [Candidatus Aphodocola excrementigallinarum]
MNNIYDYTKKDLEDYFLSIGQSKFRASQVFDWLYVKRVKSFDEMTNLKKDLITYLKNNFSTSFIKQVTKEEDVDVKKYLFELFDGNKIEAVLMHHDYGNSICVSTQVGCNMGCLFCESGRLKKLRNLNVCELVQQVLLVEEDIKERISHVVLMGIGEPFDNYDNVMKFINIINDPKGINIGIRHITVSTCGIVPKINEFANEKIGVNLAISLHAPNNKIRDMIMPINKAYKIEDIINAVKDYIKKANRRVTFEYIMLKDVNDSCDCAKELSNLLKGINCYVNLIPYNETSNIKYKKSDKVTINEFYDILKKNNINVTIRREFGSNVSAACGQLRSKQIKGKED